MGNILPTSMNFPSPEKASRPGTLFLTYLCPSFAGSGPQIRSVALLRMLASRGVVHVLVVNRFRQMLGPCDTCSDCGAAAMTYLRILPDGGTGRRWMQVANEVPFPELRAIDCELTGVTDFIVAYAREHFLEQVFVFRMETLLFVQGCLDFFPSRLLDLDELPSRRDRLISVLRDAAPNPAEKRAILMSQVLEKKFIPRFDRVFVASDAEAEEVRRQTGFPHPAVLPNIRPQAPPLAAGPSASHEILFVGVLSYYPNQDGVLWFCREVLPLLREKRGDHVRFRIVGFGDTSGLASIRNQPGVCLEGYRERLAPFYAQAALAIVPLRAGAGTRLKILEAFAHLRPVVSTTIGAEGLRVTHGKDILLADQPEAFADACLSLIDQPALVRQITKGASDVCREFYSEEALLRAYDQGTGH
jgi:glycosyltransferase involved in cell wall biosynthesis